MNRPLPGWDGQYVWLIGAARAMLDGIARGHFHIQFPRRFTNVLRLARLLPYRAYFWFVRKVTAL